MKNQLLEMLFEKTYGYVKEKLGDDIHKEQYYVYLSRKYSKILEEFHFEDSTLEERNEFFEKFVDYYAVKEQRRWITTSESEMLLSIIDTDEAFEHFELLSEQALDDVDEYFRTGIHLQCDMEEYILRLNELVQSMYGIKPRNFEKAKELLLSSIDNLNYAIGKSDFDNEDLDNITQ